MVPAESPRRSICSRVGSRSTCQGLSSAGLGLGLADPRSAMFFEMLRLIDEARPGMVLIENVATLTSRGLDVVVSGLAGAGYGCWWDVVPALACGAPHLRQRVWITALPYERMPELDGEPFRELRVKMPRAGASTDRGLIEMVPTATVKACKAAMGAVKREDGVTWLERIDSPLFPTPSSSSYGSNRGGSAGRVGPVRHSLESMARSGEWPEQGDHVRLWPTPHGMSHPDAPRAGGPSDNVLGRAVNEHAFAEDPGDEPKVQIGGRMWATPRKSDAERGGRGDLIQQVRGNKTDSSHGEQHGGSRLWPTPRAQERQQTNSRDSYVALSKAVQIDPVSDQRIFPTPRSRDWKGPELSPNGHHTTLDSLPAVTRMWPTAAAADASRGPGRSEHRLGGANLRTAVADEKPGPLSPSWVEWLQGVPIGWTDLSCEYPVQLDWLSEYGIPRVLRDVADRKNRLSALGNSLVWRVAYVCLMQALALLDVSDAKVAHLTNVR